MLARTNRWCTKSHPKTKQRELNVDMEIDSAEERHSLSKTFKGLTLMHSSAWYPILCSRKMLRLRRIPTLSRAFEELVRVGWQSTNASIEAEVRYMLIHLDAGRGCDGMLERGV